jgi:hypothetical protein
MDALKDGLGPNILREFKQAYKGEAMAEMAVTLNTDYHEIPPDALQDEAKLLKAIDTQGWLNLLFKRYNDVFKDKYGQTLRAYASELINARNEWAHQKAFTTAMATRTADTAYLLLNALGATLQAQTVLDIKRELARITFDEEARQSVKKPAPTTEELPLVGAQAGLKP